MLFIIAVAVWCGQVTPFNNGIGQEVSPKKVNECRERINSCLGGRIYSASYDKKQWDCFAKEKQKRSIIWYCWCMIGCMQIWKIQPV